LDTDGVVALRLWNAAPPGWEATLRLRVQNPWLRGTWPNAKGEWLLNATAQGPNSTVIVNQVAPGSGDLPISGGATFAEARVYRLRAG